MSQTPRVTVVTVTYASAATVGGFLDSCPTDIPVLVVDNASPDDTLAVVRATRPSAGIIANGRNSASARPATWVSAKCGPTTPCWPIRMPA